MLVIDILTDNKQDGGRLGFLSPVNLRSVGRSIAPIYATGDSLFDDLGSRQPAGRKPPARRSARNRFGTDSSTAVIIARSHLRGSLLHAANMRPKKTDHLRITGSWTILSTITFFGKTCRRQDSPKYLILLENTPFRLHLIEPGEVVFWTMA